MVDVASGLTPLRGAGVWEAADEGREGGAGPALGLPKNPARVVCFELSMISCLAFCCDV